METAKKFDTSKLRLDLLPPLAMQEMAKVLGFGAEKYGDNNWKNGMKWSRIIGALKRHLLAIEMGEDIDPESGLPHVGHVLCNAAFLTEYYSIYPEGDDRMTQMYRSKDSGTNIDK